MDILNKEFLLFLQCAQKAEKNKSVFEIEQEIFINIVPYNFLKDMKLLSRREKDLWDIARLEELRNLKK